MDFGDDDGLRHLVAVDGGDLVNISSVAGRTARATYGVHVATTWGINSWSESLHQEPLRCRTATTSPLTSPRTSPR